MGGILLFKDSSICHSLYLTLFHQRILMVIERGREGEREGGEGGEEGRFKVQGHTVMVSTIDSCFPEGSTE